MTDKEDFIKRAKEQARDHDKWENSVEGILYNLSTWGDVTDKDEKDKQIVAKTLERLPKRVREKVLNEVTFVFTASHYGTLQKLRFSRFIKKEDFEKMGDGYTFVEETVAIYLNFSRSKKESFHMDTTAHEIAHFINGDADTPKRPKGYNAERAADDLTEKWGFKRAYKSYEMFEDVNS
jgi:hypothetical protein